MKIHGYKLYNLRLSHIDMTENKKYALVECMDEHAVVGPKTIKFGIVASALTRYSPESNEQVYPIEDRQLIDSLRPRIFNGLKKVSQQLDRILAFTSHPGCGGAIAQGITEQQTPELTMEMCKVNNVIYAGHLPIRTTPGPLPGNPRVNAGMLRDLDDHHHTASRLVITVGGGISGKEIREISSGGEAFHISCDWLHNAPSVNPHEVKKYLGLHLNIAREIAEGVRRSRNPFVVFDTGRLPNSISEVNRKKVEEALGNLT